MFNIRNFCGKLTINIISDTNIMPGRGQCCIAQLVAKPHSFVMNSKKACMADSNACMVDSKCLYGGLKMDICLVIRISGVWRMGDQKWTTNFSLFWYSRLFLASLVALHGKKDNWLLAVTQYRDSSEKNRYGYTRRFDHYALIVFRREAFLHGVTAKYLHRKFL